MTQPRRSRVTGSRHARVVAETWYQALRRWETYQSEVIDVSIGASSAARFQVVGVGNWRSASSGGSIEATYSMLRVPGGSVREGLVGLAMRDMLRSPDSDVVLSGKLLARIQTSVSPATLVREEGGWSSPRERCIRYAIATLRLAAALGEPGLHELIASLQGELS